MNILITGASSGIGVQVAKRLSVNNKIYLGVHTNEELIHTKDKLKLYSNIEVLKLDITDTKDIKKLKNYNINILYLNAAIGQGGSILDIPISKIKESYDVNVFGNINLIKEAIKNMVDFGFGRIIITSSLAGILPIEFMGIYSSTKASLISLAISLKKELKYVNKNIKVCLIEPGLYKTGFNAQMMENKYDYMNKSNYFKHKIGKIRKKESRFLRFLEHRDLSSIAEKIEDAIISEKPKFIYKAPFFQALFVKIISIFLY